MFCCRFSPSITLSLLLLVTVGFPLSLSNPELFEICRFAEFKCGNISAKYPFYGEKRIPECGHPDLQLSCEDGKTPMIEIDSVKYQVLDIHLDTQTLRIARRDLFQNELCTSQTGISFQNSDLFELAPAPDPGYTNLTLLYNCPSWLQFPLKPLSCDPTGSSYRNVTVEVENTVSPDVCPASVTVPILRKSLSGMGGNISQALLTDILKAGFEIRWKLDKQACDICVNTGGACGFNLWNNHTVCYCPFPIPYWQTATECPPQPPNAPPPSPGTNTKHKESTFLTNIMWKVAIGGGAATILISVAISYLILTRKKKTRDNQRVEAFIEKYESLAPKRYSYSDVKKMTKTFKDKLGQGGYGGVYKGKLHNDQLVAVKVLSESKGDGEEFINEVASISQTSHVNVVTLLGFCYENSKRALIYEFMPNGSLDGFIYDKKGENQSTNLNWMSLYQITVGIARGLEYLHQGCKTRVLHLDIKPHNILLDEGFVRKFRTLGSQRSVKGRRVSYPC